MLIFWRIRYLDSADRTFKDRNLFLDTGTLPPAKRAAVELLAESTTNRNEREFFKFKSLFIEESITGVVEERLRTAGEVKSLQLISGLGAMS